MDRDATSLWLDNIIPAQLEFKNVEGYRLALADLGGGENLVATTHFADIDTGLHATDPADGQEKTVRCELLTVARATQPELARFLIEAIELLEAAKVIPAQPGTLLPMLGAGQPTPAAAATESRAADAFESGENYKNANVPSPAQTSEKNPDGVNYKNFAGNSAAAGTGARRAEVAAAGKSIHGMLVAPWLWGGQTPQLSEPDRWTLVLQLVALSDEEYGFAVEEGVPALQAAVGESGIDLLDWQRFA